MNFKELFAVCKATVSEFGKDDISLLAAGLTYYSFFSLFPLLLIAITLAGLLVRPEDATNFIFTRVAEVAPGSTRLLSEAVDQAFQNRSNAGLVALISALVLAFSASSAFGTLYKAVNRAWNTEHRPGIIVDRVISFLMMVGAGAFALASLILSATLTSIRSFTQERIGKVPGEQVFFQVLAVVGSLVLTFAVLVVMYRFLPRTKVLLKDVWVGALLAALVWTLIKELFSLYLGSSFQSYDAIYGTVGAVVVLLTWIYISSIIILTGAEFAAETHRYRRLNAAAEQIEESEHAEHGQGQDQRPPDTGGQQASPWF